MITHAGMGMSSDRQARFHAERTPETTFQWVFGYRGNESYSGILEGTEWMGECRHHYFFSHIPFHAVTSL